MADTRAQLKQLQIILPTIGFTSNGQSIVKRYTNGMTVMRQYVGHGGELWLKIMYLNKDLIDVDVMMPMKLPKQALAQLWASAHPILSNYEPTSNAT